MAHRKDIENWLEIDTKHLGLNLELIDVDCTSYAWHLIHQNTVYEITYSDIGEIALSALPVNRWNSSYIRDIYVGNNYAQMIGLLTDNFVDII